MRAPKVAAIVAALLLPLPLVLLVLSLRVPGFWEPGLSDGRISPVLEFEARMRLDTYRRDCGSSSECQAPLGCLEDLRARTAYCTDSQCMADSQCAEDHLCRAVPTRGGGPLVRLCIPSGERKDGEQCDFVPPDKKSACGSELLCAGEGWCARPCQRQEAANCPVGFFCADVAPEPVCLPTCQERNCPEGLRCVRYDDEVSSCARVHGSPCQEDASCAECSVSSFPRYPGEVWMQCVQRCGEGLSPCPAGSACKIQGCLPVCDRKAPGSCARGFFCARPGAEYPSVCEPEWMRSRD